MKPAQKAFTAVLFSSAFAVPIAWAQAPAPDARAAATLAQMTQEEKLTLLQGFITARAPAEKLPPNTPKGAGFVPGVPRLGIPPLVESDASLGIANMAGFMRPKDEATAMPSALAMASSWNPTLIEQAGRAMGVETRAKGFNVLLAGSVNLVREPRGGRNFEYFSEDPLLSGVLGGHSVRGIQAARVASTVKHYALNAQETGRNFYDARISEPALRESDLLAFQLAMEIGQPGSVMCAYNRVNGVYSCENAFLLNDVLRRDWGFKGFVMSDWGAVHSVSLRQGLDQESGTLPGGEAYFGKKLRDALAAGTVTQADVDRSVSRILRTMYTLGLADDPVKAGQPIDFAPHLDIAQSIAEQGIVVLKNERNLLPVARTAKRILVVGGHADIGVPQGGGSSQVWPVGGASLSLEIPGEPVYHRRLYMPSAPLAALKEQYPDAAVSFDDGSDPARAAKAARAADVVVVFGEDYRAEGHDVPDLQLPGNQNAVIAAVAKANPRTVVVLETGGPVAMPWIGQVPAVVQAWYPGNRGGVAIARVLSGVVNPSGRLPVTFPASLAQTPNPELPGKELIDAAKGKDIYDLPKEQQKLVVTYPEGSNVGYRWYAGKGLRPLFPFGHGLSYTTFASSMPNVAGTSAHFTVRNTGKRAGATVAQLYLVTRNGKPMRRLVGFERVELSPGASKAITVNIEPRLLADWRDGGWNMPGGKYAFAVGENAARVGQAVSVSLPERSWRDADASHPARSTR